MQGGAKRKKNAKIRKAQERNKQRTHGKKEKKEKKKSSASPLTPRKISPNHNQQSDEEWQKINSVGGGMGEVLLSQDSDQTPQETTPQEDAEMGQPGEKEGKEAENRSECNDGDYYNIPPQKMRH